MQICNVASKLGDSCMVQESSAKVMKFLVQDFLDYSMIKSDQFKSKIAKFNIRDTVEMVMSIQMKTANDKGVQLTAQFPGLKDPFIMADEGRII